jgi:hypothetical protein
VGASALAQPVYRCGNTYSSTPCEGGRAVEATDPRSGEQVKAAREQARREQAAGKALQREREQAEAAQAKAEAAARKAEATQAREAKRQTATQPRQAAAPAQQTQGGGSASTPRKGCVPSATVRCPEFVAVDPAPAKK